MASIKIGTCSWNYDSWVGLVYSKRSPRAAGYLAEYSKRFDTVEVDSWFYKLPARQEVEEYLEQAGPDLTFACKVLQGVTLTHLRTPGVTDETPRPNPDFLSAELFAKYIAALHPMLPRIDAIELEFEYLNRTKMASLDVFLEQLDAFFGRIEKKLPLAVETRNSNYLHNEYFALLKARNVAHVFSEKLYMPHIYDVYDRFGDLLADRVVVRLLGGDRKEMEERTGGRWDVRLEEKADLRKIAAMALDMERRGKDLYFYVNNHYEGSAPRTIEALEKLLAPGT